MSDTASRILVVDDEATITDFVGYALKTEGYAVDIAKNGEDALALAGQSDYDLYILDIMLPGIDGYELCRRLRATTSSPVLFLSARDTELDKVVGLEIGGDDYLSKPFGVRELVARVRALLRRGAGGLGVPDRDEDGRHAHQAPARQDIRRRLRFRPRGNGARLRLPLQSSERLARRAPKGVLFFAGKR